MVTTRRLRTTRLYPTLTKIQDYTITLLLVPTAPDFRSVFYDSMYSQILKMLSQGRVEQADIYI
jgi:hypothetical protein